MGNSNYAEFLRFCIVGTISTGIDASIFYIVRLFASYQVALVAGYCISLGLNYLMTMYWTFKKEPSRKSLVGVVVAHLFNLFVIRMSLMWIFVNLLTIPDKIAYVPTVLLSVITNFIVVRFVVKRN